MFPYYSDLPQPTRTQHRIGAGQILQKWGDSSPYKHLTEAAIASGFVDGIRGQNNYKLLPEAFLIDPQNYRAEILVKVFGYLGLSDCFAFVKKQINLQTFMHTRDATETPETLLHDIVERRNQASHGSVSQSEVVSVSELSSYADFIRILCGGLAEMVERRVLTRLVEVYQNDVFGQVVHNFSNNVVGLRCYATFIRVGERLVAKRTKAAMGTTVISIETNRQRCEEAQLIDGQEIGVKLDKKVKEGTLSLRLRPTPPLKASQYPTENPLTDCYEI